MRSKSALVVERLPHLGKHVELHLLSLGLYSCFALLLFFPILSSPTTTYVGGGPGPAAPDPFSAMWLNAWTPYALSHHLNPLLTDWIFSDSGANLTWNAAAPLIGAVTGPITTSAGPICSYNVAMIAGLAASAWTAYYAAFRLFTPGFLPALLAGAVYGFSPFTTAHAMGGHLHLSVAFTPPLFLLLLHDILITQKQIPWRNGAKLAVLALVQYFISAEVLLTVAVFSSIGVAVLLFSERRAVTAQRMRYCVQSLAAALLIALPALSYPLYLMVSGPWRPPHPIWGSTGPVASLLSFVLPTSPQAIASSSLASKVHDQEWFNTYLGLPLIALLVLIGYAKWGARAVRFLLTLLLAVLILSLGPTLHLAPAFSTRIPLPWRVLSFVPPFSDVLTNRFGEYLYLFVGLILALYVADASISRNIRTGRVIITLLAVAFLAPRVPLIPELHADVPNFFRLSRDTLSIDSPALVVPFSYFAPPFAGPDRSTAMLWQAEARMAFKMPEGYAIGRGRVSPPPTPLSTALIEIGKTGRAPSATPALRARIIATLKAQRIRTIVVGPCQHEREAVAFLIEVLGWAPDAADGVFVWRHVDSRIAFREPRAPLTASTAAPQEEAKAASLGLDRRTTSGFGPA